LNAIVARAAVRLVSERRPFWMIRLGVEAAELRDVLARDAIASTRERQLGSALLRRQGLGRRFEEVSIGKRWRYFREPASR
jgi:hypothetical protein